MNKYWWRLFWSKMFGGAPRTCDLRSLKKGPLLKGQLDLELLEENERLFNKWVENGQGETSEMLVRKNNALIVHLKFLSQNV